MLHRFISRPASVMRNLSLDLSGPCHPSADCTWTRTVGGLSWVIVGVHYTDSELGWGSVSTVIRDYLFLAASA